MTAAYMRILIHTMNNSLFPDADPNSVTWTGPPAEIVTVQSLLYASLATSLFAAFLAMLGKQWVNRYLRNHGGSAADKSRDRQRKLDGLEKWRFRLAIESLPVMLQFALLLLGCALSLYLWTISRTIAGVVIAVTLFGVTSYVFLAIAATLYYNCPYQTPPSIFIRTIIGYITSSNATLARSLRSLVAPLPPITNLRRILARLGSGVRSALKSFNRGPVTATEAEHVPLAVVAVPPTRIFEDISIDWEVCNGDVRCVSWVLHSTTDPDVILSTVRFAADMIWYPEIAVELPPCVLADLFFDCMLDGQVVPGKSEYASSIGMALASVLSTHLSIEPENNAHKELCRRILRHAELLPPSEPTLRLATAILKFAAYTPTFLGGRSRSLNLFNSIPDHLPITHQLLLSRVMLQTIWRWRNSQDPAAALEIFATKSICKIFTAGNGQTLAVLKLNCFLTLAISLGLRADIRCLYVPNNKCVVPDSFREICSQRGSDALKTVVELFNRQLQISIREGKAGQTELSVVLSALAHLDPFQVMGTGEFGFLWITEILNSRYPDYMRYEIASGVVHLLGKHFYSKDPKDVLHVQPAWIPPLLGFLSLGMEFYTLGPPPSPEFIALHILSDSLGSADFGVTILHILSLVLLPTHPLQSRSVALKVFYVFMSGWFSPQLDNIPHEDLSRLLQAVGDPFQFTLNGEPVVTTDYKPMKSAVVLIEFASSNLWRNHLRRSNFTSCEDILSTEEGRKTALNDMLNMAIYTWPTFLHTPAKIIAAIRRLEELQCPNIAEVVIMWAWIVGVVNPVDGDAWKLVGDSTLEFYQTHGIGRLTALKREITDATRRQGHVLLLLQRYEGGPLCRVGAVQRLKPVPLPLSEPTSIGLRSWSDLRISRACQLRRLYHLFGYDSTTWNEAVSVQAEEKTGVSLERSVTPVGFMDWTCDYP